MTFELHDVPPLDKPVMFGGPLSGIIWDGEIPLPSQALRITMNDGSVCSYDVVPAQTAFGSLVLVMALNGLTQDEIMIEMMRSRWAVAFGFESLSVTP